MQPLAVYGECVTQWRVDGNGVRYGLDYAALRAHLELCIDDAATRRRLYDDVRVMERAAADIHHRAAEAAFEKAKQQAETASKARER